MVAVLMEGAGQFCLLKWQFSPFQRMYCGPSLAGGRQSGGSGRRVERSGRCKSSRNNRRCHLIPFPGFPFYALATARFSLMIARWSTAVAPAEPAEMERRSQRRGKAFGLAGNMSSFRGGEFQRFAGSGELSADSLWLEMTALPNASVGLVIHTPENQRRL